MLDDNEIIKALEYCSSDEVGLCHICPLDGECNGDITILLKYALDLINRQKAEVERLRKSNEEMFVTISEQDAKFKKWREECENQSVLWSKHFESIFETAKETVKAEAIKEFVREHKEMMRAFLDDDNEFIMKWCEYEVNTNNLLKEMAGG